MGGSSGGEKMSEFEKAIWRMVDDAIKPPWDCKENDRDDALMYWTEFDRDKFCANHLQSIFCWCRPQLAVHREEGHLIAIHRRVKN